MNEKETSVCLDFIRLKIDYLMQYSEKIADTAEKKLAFRELQMAKRWAGYAKKELGETSPYIPAKDEKDIPPTQEVWGGQVEILSSNLDNVNLIRAKISEVKTEVGQLCVDAPYCIQHSLYLSSDHLQRAAFWFGFELANIRKSAQ